MRNCATELQQNLGAYYEVYSFVTPGARMDTNVNIAREEIKDLRSEDVVAIWGGTNDISKNNNKVAIKHVCHLVERNEERNIVIMKSPIDTILCPYIVSTVT